MDTKYLFQYCQKIVVFDGTKVLLCKRYGEADYDGIFAFIGGKMERTDQSILNLPRAPARGIPQFKLT